MKKITLTSRSLSLNVFLLIAVFILLPAYVGMIVLKSSFETYLQRELNSQIVTSIKKGEVDFSDTFQKMAVISNIFAQDDQLLNLLSDDNSTYWDRNKRFDQLVNTIMINNLFNLDGIRITMFDRQKRNYANWGLYFNDYSFLLDEDWVSDSLNYKGHIAWSLFTPSFIIGENEKYISMARSLLYPAYTGDRMATIIISINEKFIDNLLMRSNPGGDFVRVCTADTAEDVFSLNKINYGEVSAKALLDDVQKSGSGSLVRSAGGKSYLLTYYSIDSPWTPEKQRLIVLYFSDYQQIAGKLNALSMSINIGMIVFVAVLLGIVIFISRNIAKPIKLLSERVNEYTRTQKIVPSGIQRNDEIGELNAAFAEMQIKISDLFEKLRMENEVREQYRFRALRAQINPHFLFNTLNTIRWMAMIRRQDNITDTIDALSRILDYSMSRTGEIAAVSDELEMIQSYVHIQNYRYGENLEVTVDMEEGVRELGIVKFILQPAVENSFIHAFKKIRGKKQLYITGRIKDGRLKLYVKDNGSGIEQARLDELQKRLDSSLPAEDRPGIGLSSVQQRIRSAYGQEFGIRVTCGTEGVSVEYTLPIIETIRTTETEGGYEKAAGG